MVDVVRTSAARAYTDNPAKPAGTFTGPGLVVITGGYWYTNGSASSPGFTQVAHASDARVTEPSQSYVLVKASANLAAEPSTYAVTTSGGTGFAQVHFLQNVDGTTPVLGTTTVANSGSGTATVPNINVLVAGSLGLLVCNSWDYGNWDAGVTPPSGYALTEAAAGDEYASYERDALPTGNVGGAFSGSRTRFAIIQVVFQPAGGGPIYFEPGEIISANASSGLVVLENGTGATVTEVTLSTVQTHTASRARQIVRALNATASLSAVRARSVLRGRSVSQTHTAARARAAFLGRAASVTHTGSLARARILARGLAVTVSTTAARIRSLVLGRAATQGEAGSAARLLSAGRSGTATHSASRARSLARPLPTVTTAATPTVAKGQSYTRALSATVTASAARARQVARAATASLAHAAALPIRLLLRALSYSLAAAAARTRGVSRVVAATATTAPSLAKGQQYGRTITATQAQDPARQREVGVVRAAPQTQTPAQGRALARAISAVTTQVASRARAAYRTMALAASHSATVDQQQQSGGPVLMTITATATQTVAIVRAVARSLATGQVQVLSQARLLSRQPLTATAMQAPAVSAGRSYLRTLSATSAQAPTRARALGLARVASTSQGALIARRVQRGLAASHSQSLSATRALSRSRSAIATHSPSESHNQGQFVTLVAAAVQLPARAVRVSVGRLASVAQTSLVGQTVSRVLTAVQTQAASARRLLSATLAAVTVQTAAVIKGRKNFVDLSTALSQATTVETSKLSAAVEPAGPGRIGYSRPRRRRG